MSRLEVRVAVLQVGQRLQRIAPQINNDNAECVFSNIKTDDYRIESESKPFLTHAWTMWTE